VIPDFPFWMEIRRSEAKSLSGSLHKNLKFYKELRNPDSPLQMEIRRCKVNPSRTQIKISILFSLIFGIFLFVWFYLFI